MDNIGQFNAAQGAEGFGFRKLKAVHWNLEAPQLYEESLDRGESRLARGRRALRRYRQPYRPLAPGQVHGARRADREHRLVGKQPGDEP